MRKFVVALALALIFAVEARAQQQNSTSPPQSISTQQLVLVTQNPIAAPTPVTIEPKIAGSTTYYYWIVTHSGSETSAPAGPFLISNGPATLGGIYSISVVWTQTVAGATYDLLRTTSTTVPTGACGCAVGTAIANASFTDGLASTTAYTVSTSPDQIPSILTNGLPQQVTPSGQSLQAAEDALPSTGGVINVAPGSYTLSAGITFTKPTQVNCAPGGASVFTYTPNTGSAFILAWGAQPPGPGAGIYGCRLLGPGSTTSTVAIQVSTATQQVASAYIQNIYIGQWNNPSVGFGTAISMPTNSAEVQNVHIENPSIIACGIGVDAFGELQTISAGNISETTTSLAVEANTQVTVTGTSFDTDSGPYVTIASTGLLTLNGVHFETNPVALSSSGFISNSGGSLYMWGGDFLDDLTTGSVTAYITQSSGTIYVIGAHTFSAGETFTEFANLSGSVNGFLSIDNTGAIPDFNQSSGQHIIDMPMTPPSGAFRNVQFSFSKLLIGIDSAFPSYVWTLDPSSMAADVSTTPPAHSGQLGIVGANGISAGTVTLSGGSGSHTFSTAYASAPVCAATDTTAAAAVKVTATASAVSFTGTSADVIAWHCAPAVN